MRKFETIHSAMAEISRDLYEMGTWQDGKISQKNIKLSIGVFPEEEDLLNIGWGNKALFNKIRQELTGFFSDKVVIGIPVVLSNDVKEEPREWMLLNMGVKVTFWDNKLKLSLEYKDEVDCLGMLGHRLGLGIYLFRFIYTQLSLLASQIPPVEGEPIEISFKELYMQEDEVEDIKFLTQDLL